MAMVVKVRFKRASKLYDFDANGLDLHAGMHVVTETARGVELGECMTGVTQLNEAHVAAPLKPILRIATEQDLITRRKNEEREKEAFDIALERIAEHKLEMKLVDVEYAFDHSKIIFSFTANGRVDFRMLVKNLASIFKTRIELRQIGVRDEAKMLGGIGPCGRPICCRQFLGDFTPVSIKMAKEQNLSLNPMKISGLCDRLMCCLKYEQEHYDVTRKRMPRVGREIVTPDGVGTINAINVLEETVRVRIAVGDTFELRVYPIDECQKIGAQDAHRSEPRTQEEDWKSDGPGEACPAEETAPADRPPHDSRPRREGRPWQEGARPPRDSRPQREGRPQHENRQKPEDRPTRDSRPHKENRPRADRKPFPQESAPRKPAPGRAEPTLEIGGESGAQDLL